MMYRFGGQINEGIERAWATMKSTIFVFFEIFLFVHAFKIFGPNVNVSLIYTRVWKQGSRLIGNYLPDVTFNDNWKVRRPGKDAAVGRRYMYNVLAALINRIKHGNNHHDDLGIVGYDEANYDKGTYAIKHDSPKRHYYNRTLENRRLKINALELINKKDFVNNLKNYRRIKKKTPRVDEKYDLEKNIFELYDTQDNFDMKALRSAKKEASKTLNKERNEQETRSTAQEKHTRKINEIMDFLSNHYSSTNYLYEEMKRIKSTNTVKDPWRCLATFIDNDYVHKESYESVVFQCFNEKFKIDAPKADHHDHYKTNNLVVDLFEFDDQ